MRSDYPVYLQSSLKRLLDIILVIITIIPLSFFVCIFSIILLIVEGRPVFFRHKRVGLHRKFINILKLRTLKNGTDPYASSPKNNSTRLLELGKFIRRHKIDEIPQLISIIKGQMSFVGPRPEIAALIPNYKDKHFSYRLYAKPGLTGLWQIKADTSKPIYENIKYDLYYVKNASLLLDLKIIALTIKFIFKNENV